MHAETNPGTSKTTRTRERLLRPDEIITRLRAKYPKASAAQLGELYKSDYRARVEYEDKQTEFEDGFFIAYWLKRELFDRKPAHETPSSAKPTPRPKTPEEQAEATARRQELLSQIRTRD